MVQFANSGIVGFECEDASSPGAVANNGRAVGAVIVVCAKLDHGSHCGIRSSTA